jgi:hypothetical protein
MKRVELGYMTNTDELKKLDFLTIREAADICKFQGTEPIKRAIKRGELPGINLSNAQILVPREAFKRWLLAHGMGGFEGSGVPSLLKPTRAPEAALKAIAKKRKVNRKKPAKSALNQI